MTVMYKNVNDGSVNMTAGQTYISVTTGAVTTGLSVSLGRVGDWLSGVLVVPSATASSGSVTLKDGSITTVIFNGGTTSITNLVPFFIPIGARSISGGWAISAGSSITCVATGNFS